jgi:CubicO group peptidase (beta-lactamase class C family)
MTASSFRLPHSLENRWPNSFNLQEPKMKHRLFRVASLTTRQTLFLLACIASLFCALTIVQFSGAQTAEPDFAELEKVVLDELKATNTPGAAIGIVRGDRLIYAKGFGTSNVETGAPVTPNMLFRLGSTTKMFTAAALVQLAEAGKLKLDDPIGKHAKGLSPKIAQLTSHQLLSHTGGLRDDAVMFGQHDDAALGETARGLKDDFLFTEPSRIFSYSNAGYWLAGFVVEQVSGKPYADQLNEALFKPLGMQSTTLRPTMAMTWPLSQGHEGAPPKVIRPAADNAGNWPAGSIFSSVNDLSRWAIALLNGGKLDGQQVLAPSLIALLSAPHAATPGSDSHYGYGLTSATERGVRRLQHGGSRSGYGSVITLAPEQRVGLIILANRSGASLPRTAEKALELLLPFTPKASEKTQSMAMSEAEMQRCVGVFAQGSNSVELMLVEGKLFAKRGNQQFPVNKVGEGRFTGGALERPTVSFALVFGADGKAEYFHAGGRSLRRIK